MRVNIHHRLKLPNTHNLRHSSVGTFQQLYLYDNRCCKTKKYTANTIMERIVFLTQNKKGENFRTASFLFGPTSSAHFFEYLNYLPVELNHQFLLIKKKKKDERGLGEYHFNYDRQGVSVLILYTRGLPLRNNLSEES